MKHDWLENRTRQGGFVREHHPVIRDDSQNIGLQLRLLLWI